MSRTLIRGDDGPSKDPSTTTAPTQLVSLSAFELLLIELVPQAQRIASQLHARDAALAARTSNAALFAPRRTNARRTAATTTAAADGNNEKSEGGKHGAAAPGSAVTTAPGAGRTDGGAGEDDEEDDEEAGAAREAVFHRLDGQGYRVGQMLAERFSVGAPRPAGALEAIKFVCKELWTAVHRKQIDNLKTNHRGTFVLTDARFPPLARVSVDRKLGPRTAEAALARAQPFLWWHCGAVRGALSALGIEVAVNAECQEVPVAVFQVRVVGSKP